MIFSFNFEFSNATGHLRAANLNRTYRGSCTYSICQVAGFETTVASATWCSNPVPAKLSSEGTLGCPRAIADNINKIDHATAGILVVTHTDTVAVQPRLTPDC